MTCRRSTSARKPASLSPRIDWYVIDDRTPIRDTFTHQSDVERRRSRPKLDKRVGEVIKEARLNGIRPMTIEQLLAYLGYDMNAAIVGRAEAVDPNAMRRLTDERARQVEAPAQSRGRPQAKPRPTPKPPTR